MGCPNCGFSVLDTTRIPFSPYPEPLSSLTPSPSEAAAIQMAIEKADQNIWAIEEELERLKRALNAHSARRRELQEFELKQRSMLSALRKLPNELLVQIFLACREDTVLGVGELRFASSWIMTRVCGLWREVAISTPSLWAVIDVSRWSKGYTSERCLIQLLTQQIQWSGAVPLTLQWEQPKTLSEEGRQSMLELLLSVAHRWRDANLVLSHQDYADVFKHQRSFPLLHKLGLSRTEPSSREYTFPACPLLRDLALPPQPSLERLDFPWAQLRTCRFSASPPGDVLALIRLMPNLVEASIDRTRNIQHQDHHTETTSPTLQRLSIALYGDGTEDLLRALLAPALQHLVVENSHLGPELHGFLVRSRCTLTSLRLRYIKLPGPMLLDILASTPDLTQLAVLDSEMDVSDALIGTLTADVPGSPTLVPHLASLSLSGTFMCGNSVLLQMLRSRCATMGWGKLIFARLRPRYGSPIIPCVDDLRAAGFDVTVKLL
ncbi:hypothetical protein C8R47DRAFT_1099485 [Mycena vitilis]|nr:hypothetical protein C8R47DRAFT_1099485 [Mycena vitilis]